MSADRVTLRLVPPMWRINIAAAVLLVCLLLRIEAPRTMLENWIRRGVRLKAEPIATGRYGEPC